MSEITDAGVLASLRGVDGANGGFGSSPTARGALKMIEDRDAEIARLTSALSVVGVQCELPHKAIEEFIYDRDGLAAWLTDRRNQAHSDGDTWSKGWHDANEETLAFVREVAFKRSSEAVDAVIDSASPASPRAEGGVTFCYVTYRACTKSCPTREECALAPLVADQREVKS